MRLILVLVTASLAAASGAEPCEPSAEVREALKRFDIKDLAGEKRRAISRQIAEELISQFPTNYFVVDRFERTFHFDKPEIRQSAQAKLTTLTKQYPDNAGVTLVYAKSLVDYDTPRAIELLKASAHPWANVALADVYSYGSSPTGHKPASTSRHSLPRARSRWSRRCSACCSGKLRRNWPASLLRSFGTD